MNYEHEKQVAIAALMHASQLCEQVRRDRYPNSLEKPDHSPVTIADYGTQAILCKAIAEAFPSDPIVAEEDARLLRQPAQHPRVEQITTYVQSWVPELSASAVLDWIDRGNGQPSSRYWTLDPIDGTKGFLRGDQYAIALALIEAGEVRLGMLACPALELDPRRSATAGVLFVAVRGQGTQQISLLEGTTQSVQVAQRQYGFTIRLAESVESGHGDPAGQRAIAAAVGLTHPPLQMDSQAKYGVVARGEAVLYMRFPWLEKPDYQENIWDHAAGAIVVEEAGGTVTDMEGKPLDFSVGSKLSHNRGIVASNGIPHAKVLNALRQSM